MKSPPNPYVGPRSFRKGETLYGRDRELADLVDLLITERIVLLYSPSGAGKSSLIQAGLIPRMAKPVEKGGFGLAVRNTIRVNAKPAGGAAQNRYWASMMESLRCESLDPQPNGELLILDQFEEVLTADPTDVNAKRQFFRQLGEALRPQGRWALFAMREEYVAGLDPYLRYLPTRLSNTFRLDLLSLEASLDAIRRPAAQAGVSYDPGAAEQIADDLRKVNVVAAEGTGQELGEFVEPVQLQVVCLRRWEDLPEGSKAIPKSTQPQVGSTALADYYSATVVKAARDTGIAERAIRSWFEDHLITKLGTRGQVVKGPEKSEGLENRAVDALVEAHLVRSEQRLGSMWLELSHDRLIEPVRSSNRDFKGKLDPFQREAELWDELGRPEDRLWVSESLAQAEAWASGNTLNAIEEDFLRESRKMERRRLKDIRQARVLKAGAAVLAGLLVAALWLFKEANKSREKAEIAEAEAGRALAKYDIGQVPVLAGKGEPAKALAYLARALRSDPGSPRARAWAGAYLGRGAVRIPFREVDHRAPVLDLVFSRNGGRLLTHGRESTRVWDVKTGESAGPAITGKSPQAALSEDGTLAILSNQDLSNDVPNTHIFDIGNGQELGPQEGSSAKFPPQYLWQVFSLPGKPRRVVVTRRMDAAVELWDLDARKIESSQRVSGEIRHAAINAGGNAVLIVLNRTALVWRLTDASGSFPRGQFPDLIADAALSPDGQRAVAIAGKKAYLWQIGGARPRELAGSEGAASAGFTTGGERVVVTGKSGNASWLGLWDVSTAKPSPNVPRWETGHDIYFASGQSVFAECGNGALVLRDAVTFRPAVQVFLRGCADWSLSRDGRTLATIVAQDRRRVEIRDATARLADISDRKAELVSKDAGPVPNRVVSADGSRVLVMKTADEHFDEPPEVRDAKTDGVVKQIRLGSGARVPGGTRYAGALSKDGKLVALADSRGLAEVFDLGAGRTVKEWTDWRGVATMRFSDDGNYLVAGFKNGIERVWELTSGAAVGGPVNKADPLYLGSGSVEDAQALADLAEIAGGMRLVPDSDTPEKLSLEERMKRYADLLARKELDPQVVDAIARFKPE